MTSRQRALVAMIDGLDPSYLAAGEMPRLRALGAAGLSTEVDAVMPTVTNVNNVSICCAAWPSEHGVTGNSYLDPSSGQIEYMESAGNLRSPTIVQRVVAAGGQAALLTAKVKTVGLLGQDATLAIAAERPAPDVVERYGPAPDIYSAEINHWLWTVAIDLLATRPELDLLYVHTTDFPMHAWAPGAPESDAHLARLDELIDQAARSAPDVALFAAADHGMGYKTRVWDLHSACAHRGTPVRQALSVERDRYLRHHRTFGGTAWIWLTDPSDADAVAATLLSIDGVEHVFARDEAAARFHLDADRIGDLVVVGDGDTVFGELPGDEELELLPREYRSHGSLHEQRVPLFAHNSPTPYLEPPRANKDLLAPLLDGWLTGLS
jgi:phosphonoacetate hydrolase